MVRVRIPIENHAQKQSNGMHTIAYAGTRAVPAGTRQAGTRPVPAGARQVSGYPLADAN